MSTSSRDNRNRGGRPRTGIGQLIGVRLHPPQLSELDDWIAEQSDPKPSRPEAIRRLVEKALRRSRES